MNTPRQHDLLLKFPVISLLVACASACAAPLASQGHEPQVGAKTGLDPKVYFPLVVGNVWTYEARTPGGVSKDQVRIVGRDGAWFLDDHKGKLRTEADGVRDHDRYLLRAPLVAGKKWTSVENLVVQRFEVVSTEAKVAVPAGTFEGVVVIRNDQALPSGARFVTEWSYAPQVGLISMKTATVTGGRRLEQVSVQLLQFEAGVKPK